MGRKKLHLNTSLFAQKPRLHERAVAVLLDSLKKPPAKPGHSVHISK